MRILIVLPNWIGDVLFTTPAIHAVRLSFPDAKISVLVWPNCAAVVEGNPDINEVLLNDEKGIHRGVFGKTRLILALRSKRFDHAILFSRSRTRAAMSLLAGISRRTGYGVKGRSFLLTNSVDAPEYDSIHRVEYYLGILRGDGILTPKPYRYVFNVGEDNRQWAKKYLQAHGVDDRMLKIVINPCGNWAPKRWSAANFGLLAKKLIEDFNARIILVGVSKDQSIFDEVLKEILHPIISAVGQTNLEQLGALIEASDLYIGNDSGPTHIAQALGTPFIGLFGPQDPNITGPYGEGRKIVLFKNKGCQVPCFLPKCEWNRCIDEIKVEDVIDAAKQLLKRN